jgi:15-cis-phytoene synthase
MSVAAASRTPRTGPVSLAESRQFCEQLTKAQARNFYYGLKLLPETRRAAMFALYAYMRLADDIADGQDGHTPAQRIDALEAWANSTRSALAGNNPGDGCALWPAFIHLVQTFGVPGYVFEEVIAAQRQDIDLPVFENFKQLEQYCYRVAGVVGVASIHVFGFEGGQPTIALAIDRGTAFQLTNILRDLREDAGRGRIYLPRQELIEAGVSDKDILAGHWSPAFAKLMDQQIERAREYYHRSAALESRIDRQSRPTLAAMTEIYRGLLEKMSADPRRVLRERISLSPLKKLRIAWRAARSR